MVNEGDKVLINGKTYVLGNRLGGGLEGSIFNVCYCCPFYFEKKRGELLIE